MARIGYGKIGRSWKLDPTNGTSTGGDADVARALHLLSRLRPEDTFVLIGKNSGENPQSLGYPENVVNLWSTEYHKATQQTIREISPKPKGQNRQFSVETLPDVLAYHESIAAQMFADLDEVIMWAGQHGTSNVRLPSIEDRSTYTNPQDSFLIYASYLLQGINLWRDANPGKDVIWLNPDPRNYLKMRDLKEPLLHPVLAQFEKKQTLKHERYGDETEPPNGIKWDKQGGVWVAPQRSIYSALELTALPGPDPTQLSTDYESRMPFGIIANENRAYVANDRASAVRDWVVALWPEAEVFGKWSKKGAEALGRGEIRIVPYQHLGTVLQRWMCTITTPASGSGWATAKPWECFAYGVVCFFHPGYDTQGHIIPTLQQMSENDHVEAFNPDGAALARWLRVESPEDLKRRVDYLVENPDAWVSLIEAQRAYFVDRYNANLGGVKMIMERLDGTQ